MILASVIGNLGKDAETKNINGKEYLSFSVASTEKKGEQEVTTWISVLAGNNPNLLPYLKKGQQVFVLGRMTAGIYQSQNTFGVDISIFAQTLQLCGGKREESAAPSSSLGVQPQQPSVASVAEPQQPQTPFPPTQQEQDGDLPF